MEINENKWSFKQRRALPNIASDFFLKNNAIALGRNIIHQIHFYRYYRFFIKQLNT